MKLLALALVCSLVVTNFDGSEIFAAGEGSEETSPSDSGATPATTPAATATPAPATGTEGTTPPAKKLKKKRKKPATAGTNDGTSAEAGPGHGAQESGVPYKANVDLDLGFNSHSSSTKYKDNTYKDSSTSLNLAVTWLFVLGRMEVGPRVSYENTTMKDGQISTTTKSNTLGFGGAFYFNFGNIHADRNVPYAGLSVVRSSISSDNSSTKIANTTIDLGLEGGLKYFMGAHLALKPFLSYDLTVNGESKTEASGVTTVGSVTGSGLNLGLGLAKYF